MFYKILNEEENHNGLQYKFGLIEDPVKWNPRGSCEPGGIYYSDKENICRFLYYGVFIREVTIPKRVPIYKDPEGGKFKSPKIKLGKKRDLRKASTWKWMFDQGIDIHACEDAALRVTSAGGHLSVVKFLVSKGADIHADDDYALRRASENGHLEVVKFLVSKGADIHAWDDYALRQASLGGRLEVVKFLVSRGADIRACDDYALRAASLTGHLDVVKFLVYKGADIHANNDCALVWALGNRDLRVVEYLKEQIKKESK